MRLNCNDLSILPYMELDGIWSIRDSKLKEYYRLLDSYGYIKTTFFMGAVRNEAQFISYLKHPGNHVFFVYSGETPVIIAWINRPFWNLCLSHFVTFRVGRKLKVEAAKLIISEWLKVVDSVFGMTPAIYGAAIKFIQAAGMQPIGRLPKLFTINGEKQDAILTCATR